MTPTQTPASSRRGSPDPPQFEPINQLRAHEYVADQIRRHIALRLISPGESLPSERDLAAMFGVGRPTVQHAMRLLEADRLVEARRGRGGGTFVSAPSESEVVMDELIARVWRERHRIEDMLVFRGTIEPAVAKLSALTRKKSDLTAMKRAARAMPSAADEDEYMRHDTEFHLAIASSTGNSLLTEAIEQVRLGLNDAFVLMPESNLWHVRIGEQHEAVIDAIEAGAAEAAEVAMDEHVADTEQGVRAMLAWVGRRRG